MDKFRLFLIFLIILIFSFTLVSFAQERDLQAIKDIREDIQIINLLNSLDLKKGQMEFIVKKAHEAGGIKADAFNKVGAYKSQILEVGNTIKQEVALGRVTIEKTEAKKRFHEIQRSIGNITKEAKIKIEKKAQEIEEGLEEFQLAALDNYKPCIIPIATKGRIGQSDVSTGITGVLERVKLASESRYAQNKDKLINKLLDKIKAKAPRYFQIDEVKTRLQIIETFEKVRSMDDVDFQIKKTSIAEDLRNKLLPKESGLNRRDKIKRFLLTENAIYILEERLKSSS